MTKHISDIDWIQLIRIYKSSKCKTFGQFYNQILTKDITIDYRTHSWIFDEKKSSRYKSQKLTRALNRFKDTFDDDDDQSQHQLQQKKVLSKEEHFTSRMDKVD